MVYQEDSYEKALRVYGSDAEKLYEVARTQVIGKHTITVYKKRKEELNKPIKKIVYKL
tara:strand:- start:253 stop:426 length:174 start_codon:yes stop_codon:yes gene_type:complete